MKTHNEYYADVANYLKILKLTQERVENKIKELIPHPKRIKRGLVNIVGSVFKAVTGNLDASDGDHYEKLIQDLQENQNKLAGNIRNQNSISTSVINQFNLTVQQIGRNEELLEKRINQIGMIVQTTTYRENMHFIKDILNQVINLYEIIDSILQDIENSITFTKLKIVHPSIIKINDLYNELKKLEKNIGPNQLPLSVELENIFLFENLIDVDCFILNNKITFLIKIPIVQSNNFDYFHLYSLPILHQGRFKAVIPQDKYLMNNQLHYAHRGNTCKKIQPESYLCDQETLKEVEANSPCEVQLLQITKNLSNCQQIDVTISDPIINQLDASDKWILILPKEEITMLKCHLQAEHLKLHGSYLISLPFGCQMKIKDSLISNDQEIIEINQQPIIFPDIETTPPRLPVLNLSFHLQEIKLDELHKIKNKIEDNQPPQLVSAISRTPSIWSLFIYLILLAISGYIMYKYITQKWCRRKETTPGPEAQPAIQLPLTRCS